MKTRFRDRYQNFYFFKKSLCKQLHLQKKIRQKTSKLEKWKHCKIKYQNLHF